MKLGLRQISFGARGKFVVVKLARNGEVINSAENFESKQAAFINIAADMKVDDLHLVEVQDNAFKNKKRVRGVVNRKGVFTPDGKRPVKAYTVRSLR